VAGASCPNGATQLSGVNVIARNVANRSSMRFRRSPAISPETDPSKRCRGNLPLHRADPGAQYASVDDLQGGFDAANLPGLRSFQWRRRVEQRCAWHFCRDGRGATRTGVNVIFNMRPGEPLPVGDVDSVELFPRFRSTSAGSVSRR
jgi:hypothetical protein